MSLSGAGRRTKGAVFERSIVETFRLLYDTVRRGLPQTAGALEADVEGLPIHIECKKRSSWPNIGQALAQAARDCAKGMFARPYACVTAKDREEPIISFPIRQFIRFVTEERARVRASHQERRDVIAAIDLILLRAGLTSEFSEGLRGLRQVIIDGKHIRND